MEPHVKRAYIALALLIAIANVAPIPVYVHMMATTLLIIYIGSHSSIPGSTTGGNTDEQQFSEQMQTKDAMMFPVFGSIVLFSLYLIFKFIPKEYVTIVIKGYFFVFGLLVLGHRFSYILAHFLPDAIVAPFRGISVTLSNPCSRIPKDATPAQIAKWKSENALTLSGVDFLGFMVATGVAVWYILTNHWAASNIFGIAFSIQGIELLSLGSFINGCILLSGLFVYDIFWVFGTDVMVTVAKSFDAPIKLLFPQAFGGSPSMLGLGDVVLPGVFIALMLRFDLSFHHDEQKAKHVKKYAINNTSKKGKGKSSRSPTPTPKPFTPTYVSGGSIDTPYFYSQMLWYFVGLSTTVFVMYYFQHAQPALLYLVPTCFLGAFGTALIRGEVRRLLYFKEDAPQAPPETLAKKIVQKTKPLEVSMAEENPPKEEQEEEEEEESEEEEEEEEEEESEPEPEPEPVKPKKTASGKAKASAAAPAPTKVAAPAPKKKSGKK